MNGKNSSQLIILGNGFDLKCGLESSYKDFFEWRYNNDTFRKEYMKLSDRYSVPNKDITVWDVIFYERYKEAAALNGILWVDVERELLRTLSYFAEHYNSLLSFSYPIIPNSGDYSYWNKKDVGPTLVKLIEFKYKPIVLDSPGLLYGKDFKQFCHVLKEELKEFESSFVEFLRNSLIKNRDYVSNANKTLQTIIKANNKHGTETNIRSFNYTLPFDTMEENKTDGLLRSINVHGDIDSEDIIFGIDLNSLDKKRLRGNEEVKMFTKSYRKISRTNNTDSSFLENKIGTIKFYGHSLGEADYSYFQSIFDIVKLYSSTTKLIFLYSIYDDREDEIVRRDWDDKVFKLIEKYGETFTNKDHGKNLVDKLVAENRLLVQRI
jgi:hypothetical protein